MFAITIKHLPALVSSLASCCQPLVDSQWMFNMLVSHRENRAHKILDWLLQGQKGPDGNDVFGD